MTIPAIAPSDSEACFPVGLDEGAELLMPNESQRVNIFLEFMAASFVAFRA